MQRSSTWILKSLWGACERWNKSDCVDLSAAFAYYTLQSFFPILLISLSIASWFLGKQEGLDQQIIAIAAQLLPPSVVELVETTLFNLIDQGFGAGILGAMFLLFTAGNAYLSLQRGRIGFGRMKFLLKKLILLGECKLRSFSEIELKPF